MVITESLIDKDLIIGRDFLKKYNVTINHGTDTIFIDKASMNQKLSDPFCYVQSYLDFVNLSRLAFLFIKSKIHKNKKL